MPNYHTNLVKIRQLPIFPPYFITQVCIRSVQNFWTISVRFQQLSRNSAFSRNSRRSGVYAARFDLNSPTILPEKKISSTYLDDLMVAPGKDSCLQKPVLLVDKLSLP